MTLLFETKTYPGEDRFNLTGRRFGMLKVIGYAGTDARGTTRWVAKCVCGNEIVLKSHSLSNRIHRSCGKCIRREQLEQMCKAK